MKKFGTVKKGSTGTDVIVLQVMLRMLGRLGKDGKQIAIDGECGDNTVYAIRELQKWSNTLGYKMRTDGIFDDTCFRMILRY